MKTKNIIRLLVCALALTLALCLLVSCGEDEKAEIKDEPAETQDTVADTAADTEDSADDEPDAPISEPVNDIDGNWTVLGTKFDMEFGTRVEDDITDMFTFTVNDDDEIIVRSNTADICDGYFPTASITSRETVPLEDLSVGFHVDDGFTYSFDGQSYCSAMSVMWTDQIPTEICEYLDGPGTNGLRECLPEDVTGFCVSFMGTDETDGSVSNLIYVIRYDGNGLRPEIDNRLGNRFAVWQKTDLGELTTLEVSKDEDLGYVITVNGEELRTGTQGSDLMDIYLSILRRVGEGYLTIGGTANNYNEINFTLSTINGESAGSYFD